MGDDPSGRAGVGYRAGRGWIAETGDQATSYAYDKEITHLC